VIISLKEAVARSKASSSSSSSPPSPSPVSMDLKRRFEKNSVCVDCGKFFSVGGLKRHHRMVHAADNGRQENMKDTVDNK